jgi:hypothetical protein
MFNYFSSSFTHNWNINSSSSQKFQSSPPIPSLQPPPWAPKLLNPVNPHPQTQSPLCQLPPEIFTDILSHLPASSAAVLAITCHGLYAWAVRNPTHLQALRDSPGQRGQFLDLIDDHPGYLACRACLVLHPWRGGSWEDGDSPTTLTKEPGRLNACGQGTLRVCGHYTLDYSMVQLVLRGVRYGEKFGLPLSSLKHSCSDVPKLSKIHKFETDVAGKVVGGRLLLRVGYKIRVNVSARGIGDLLPLGEQLRFLLVGQEDKAQWNGMGRWKWRLKRGNKPNDKSKGKGVQSDIPSHLPIGCIHSSKSLPDLVAAAVLNAQETGTHMAGNENEVLDSKDKPHQCRYCATDILISASPSSFSSSSPSPSSNLFTLNILSYKDLGPTHPHTSLVWTSSTHPFANALDRCWALPYRWSSLKDIFEFGGEYLSGVTEGGQKFAWRSGELEERYPCLQDCVPRLTRALRPRYCF